MPATNDGSTCAKLAQVIDDSAADTRIHPVVKLNLKGYKMTGPTLLKKLSIATAIGKVPCEVKKITNAEGVEETIKRGIEQPLMRVMGLATGIKTGNSTFGEWVSFSGEFEATNVVTGEIFRSNNVFLPDVATDMLLPVVKAAAGSQVAIGFDIGAKPFANAQGYEYTVVPLTKPAENDALAQLKASLFADIPALPAPKTVAIAAPTAEAAPEAPAATEAPKADSKKK